MYHALLCDLDGTLTPIRSAWQHIHERLGLWESEARRHQEAFLSGAIDYEEFCARDARHWKGLREDALRDITDAIPYRPGAVEAIAAARAAGAVVGIVSTGLTLLADRARRELGVDFCLANRLLAEDGVLTGGVEVNVRHGGKGEAVDRFCARFGLDPKAVVSLGDTEGDISMFERTGLSVAVHPANARTTAAAVRVHRDGTLLDLVRGLSLGAPERAREAAHER